MLLGTSKRTSMVPPEERNLKLFCNEKMINCTDTYTYLGTILDHNLNLAIDFDQKYKKASSKLSMLRKLTKLLTTKAAIAVCTSMIVPAVKYNSIVHLNLTETQQKKLKSLESRANSITNTKSSSLKNEFQKHAVILVNKCLNEDVCSNFHNYFHLNTHSKNTRNNNILVKVPKVKLEFARNGFFFMGAKLYNALPKHVRESKNDIGGFKNKVKLCFQ
jgi:hypothetical protein